MSHLKKEKSGDTTPLISHLQMDNPSEYRLWYNNRLNRLASNNPEWKVLDVGKSEYWDYRRLWEKYTVTDVLQEKEPDVIDDICNSRFKDDEFNLVLCNGMYEYVDDPKKMADEVWRILKPKGTAIFGFVGKDYKNFGKNGNKWDGDMTLLERFKDHYCYNFGETYHYIVCKKPTS